MFHFYILHKTILEVNPEVRSNRKIPDLTVRLKHYEYRELV